MIFAARCRVLHCGFVLIALWLAGCRSQVDDPQILRVGTSGDYPPFSEAIALAPGYRGFDIALAHAFAQEHGYEIRWVPFRWPELARDFSARRFDLAMSGVTVRADRSVLGRFSVPVVSSGAVALYREARFASVAAVDLARLDRSGVRVVVNRGGHLERVTRARFARASVEAIADNAAVREALVTGRADVVVTDTIEAPHWRRGLGGVGQIGPLTRDRKAYWIAVEREDLARTLDRWLIAREADGTLARLRERWFGSGHGEASASPASALVAAIDERLSLMSWVAESKRVAGRGIEDPAREQRVLAAAVRGVERAARTAGVRAPAEAAVLAFYREQIEAAKDIQRRTLAGPAAMEARAEDLATRLRPALIRIGERMARLVVRLPQGGSTALALGPALERYQLDPARIAALTSALEQLASGGIEGQVQHGATVDAAR